MEDAKTDPPTQTLCQRCSDVGKILLLAQSNVKGHDYDGAASAFLQTIRYRFFQWGGQVGAFTSDHTSLDYLQQKSPELAEAVLFMLSVLQKNLSELVDPTECLTTKNEEGQEDSDSRAGDSKWPGKMKKPQSPSPTASSADGQDFSFESSVLSFNLSNSEDDSKRFIPLSQANDSEEYRTGNEKWDNHIRISSWAVEQLFQAINTSCNYVLVLEDLAVKKFIEVENPLQDSGKLLEQIERAIDENLQWHNLLRPEIKLRLAHAAKFRSMKLFYLGRHGNDGGTSEWGHHSIDDFSGENSKRQRMEHVLQKLQPYVCIFPDCSVRCEGSELPMFSTAEEWLAHMKQGHRLYFCQLCLSRPKTTTPDLLFRTQKELRDHLDSEHTTRLVGVGKYHLESLRTREAIQPIADFFTPEFLGQEWIMNDTTNSECCCPFTERKLNRHMFERPQNHYEEGPIANPELMYRSIRTHMEILALESLPGGETSALSPPTSDEEKGLMAFMRANLMAYVVGETHQESMKLPERV